MQSKSFSDIKGEAGSLQRLATLRLPNLKDKRFLDLGCNEGFFCGYAYFDGACEVVGIDPSKTAIEIAKKRFSAIDFRHQTLDELPQGPFDVITMLFALQSVEDQEAMIHKVMSRLSADGLLVLEVGIAPGGASKWVTVKHSTGEYVFPSKSQLTTILKGYAWKIIDYSSVQPGDPYQHFFVHVKRMKPYAFLFIQAPASGKTIISRKLFGNSKTPLISGDRLYEKIAHKKLTVSPALQQAVSKDF